MKQEKYIGHSSQIFGVEEYRCLNGKSDGMHVLHIRNGLGMELMINADRCADISRLSLDGKNLSYTSVVGNVAPDYFSIDSDGFGFLKSFNCGFITTCGFDNIGNPNEDEGTLYGLHGNVGNIPAEYIYHTEDATSIEVHAIIKDHAIFGKKFTLHRTYVISKTENTFALHDKIVNEGSAPSPLMYMYHMNIGYPLLTENSEFYINSYEVVPRDEEAKKGLAQWNQMIPPTPNFAEQCFYHHYHTDLAKMMVYNKDIEKGIQICFDTKEFPQNLQWKMMGERDYVLGLEPCTADLDGRHTIKKNSEILTLEPAKSKDFSVNVHLFNDKSQWESAK